MVLSVTWSHPETSMHPVIDKFFPILEMKIQQREGEVASAQLVVPRETNIPPDQWITLWHHDQSNSQDATVKNPIPLFYGRCVGIPSILDEYSKKIEYLAIPIDTESQHNLLIEQLKQDGHVDDLFICPAQRHNPAEYLEATPQLFCYHRVTHKMVLSNLFEGRETLTLKDQILSGGLVLKLNDSPLSAVRLRISQEWIQEAQGEINLMPILESRFSQGIINTLTPQSLISTWPKVGQLLGRSGYGVVRSELRMIQPNILGGEGHYPTLTPLIQGHRFSRTWLGGELVVAWQYRQKRREVLTVNVHQVTQLPAMQVKAPRVISLKLNKPQARASFVYFDTPEGKSALSHALKIAQCHLAYSARAAEVTVEIPFEEGIGVHLDQSIEVIHQCLPEGRIRGKLVSYVLERSPKKTLATLKVALSVGVGENSPLLEGKEREDDITGEELEGIGAPEKWGADDFVAGLVVSHTAEEQMAHLMKDDDPTQLPAEAATQIQFSLKDLRSHDVLERALQAGIVRWTGPRQIVLS